jgi:DnaA family protein
LAVSLADLRSRLAGGLVLQLRPLRDEEKAEVMRLQARQRGMEMPEELAAYLLRRCPRDMTALFALVEVLDQASLAAQRKLTIPFVKEVLEMKFRV